MLATLSGQRPEVIVKAVTGVPAETLVAAAADADMIVVGSRGSGGFERLTMGSVGDQVARHARLPGGDHPAREEGLARHAGRGPGSTLIRGRRR